MFFKGAVALTAPEKVKDRAVAFIAYGLLNLIIGLETPFDLARVGAGVLFLARGVLIIINKEDWRVPYIDRAANFGYGVMQVPLLIFALSQKYRQIDATWFIGSALLCGIIAELIALAIFLWQHKRRNLEVTSSETT